jgi:hypothetical protein
MTATSPVLKQTAGLPKLSHAELKALGARVTVSVRRIKVAIASACPYRTEFALAHLRLATWTGPPRARSAA